MGTAVIGIILILGVFWGLQTSIQEQFPGKYSAQQIKDNLPTWYDEMNKKPLSVFRTNREPEKSVAGRIVDGTIRKSTSITFYSIAAVFFLGLISALFTPFRRTIVNKEYKNERFGPDHLAEIFLPLTIGFLRFERIRKNTKNN